ncbi:hypothetical protein PPACK8108_LOCUS6597 [Phakopsora pachyrhizi]|uniref:Uncharacterized protein n=1 Tax=Phakopsora pachyrhizi TaxID=170000 RepID=A0AAV0ARA4_PHAPC|nr:hypothetical protein PPACK8108_LOCUS6597 [Phakopsora pachyrhizi]
MEQLEGTSLSLDHCSTKLAQLTSLDHPAPSSASRGQQITESVERRNLIFLESKFLVKKLFGLGKKDEKDDELESGISEGQFRRETIEPILQIEEYDDDDDNDNDKERDNKNHNQESSGSEVVAMLKVFNVQAGSSVHTRALNNSKRFQ